MPRNMRDSVTPGDIPLDGTQMVMGYGNGHYAWDAAGWDRFKHIPRASIDINGTRWYSDVLDVENGDASVADAVAWVRRKHASPLTYAPIIYCNRSTLTPLFNAMNAAGFHIVSGFKLIVATLDGTKELADMTGVTGIQYAGEAHTGGHWDETIVYDDSWMPGEAPPIVKPPVQQVRHGVLVEVPDGATVQLGSTDGGKTWH